MTKQELIDKLMTKTKAHITRIDTERILRGFVEEVTNAVAAGETVQIPMLGTFKAKERAARNARNPKTGETINVPAKKAPVFKPSNAFKDSVNK